MGILKTPEAAIVRFEPISSFRPGDLSDIIRRSYAGLVEKEPDFWAAEGSKWNEFDRQAFSHPDTVGRCVFLSRLQPMQDRPGLGPHGEDAGHAGSPGQAPVGLASYDPRPGPRFGIIGQNCVLPEYRGRGFGKMQILEVLRRFRTLSIREARVTTSEHPFFFPALRMYMGVGFQEARRYTGGPDPRCRLIELKLELDAGPKLDRP